ncbi:MAG: lytic transglycosylase domain-containing protein [Acidobacteria bacterium]|nr:lytic transglycosylase domain-containing protein [Acidobacteriota bacterium]MBV9478716.1 lytic transglycosylase domain-containing protein [Acidobacteriota bacterium]
MRVIAAIACSALLAASVGADVRLGIKADGSKVIYNVGGSTNPHLSDLHWLAARHDRHSKFDKIIQRYADQYNVDATLVRAVIQVESDFDPQCVSHKGARGLMQLMPETARRFGVSRIHDPEQNISGGVQYLSYLMELFREDLPRVLAAYNAGEGAVLKYGGVPPYAETTEYVRRAMTVYSGKPYGASSDRAVIFAARRGGPKLKGGFGAQFMQSMVPALIPGMKYLGTH